MNAEQAKTYHAQEELRWKRTAIARPQLTQQWSREYARDKMLVDVVGIGALALFPFVMCGFFLSMR